MDTDPQNVDLRVKVSTTHVLTGVSNTIDVLAQVVTGKLPSAKSRSPLNLAIVLDKSGSMKSGNKLANAKLAICRVIAELTDKDVLHLVAYDAEVVTVFENKPCLSTGLLTAAVEQIEGGSTTNLWGGLEQGVQLLVKHKLSGYNHRIFLFSDGLVNAGVTDKTDILRRVSDLYEEHSIQISAFGLGDDFDESLMRGIAEKGIGSYFFVDSANSIPTFVDFALKTLQTTVGTDALLKVRGLNSGIVKKFYGGYDIIKGAALGDLRAENTRKVLLRMKVSPLQGSANSESILECTLSYRKIVDGAQQEFVINKVIPVTITEDAKLVEQNKDIEVHVNTVLQKIAKLDKKLAKIMESDRDKALKIMSEEISLLESVVEIDKTQFNNQNKVELLLKLTKENREKFKEKGATKQAMKEVHNKEYLVEHGDLSGFDLFG